MKKISYCSSALLLIMMLACKKDFVVENIANKTLTVNGPGNNLETTSNLITFWWEVLDGAEKYTLQVVKPSFAQVAQLVLDTNITGNKFTLSLQPGKYQWRVKATNAGYATVFQTFSLQIDTTDNLSQQLVNLLNPTNNLLTGAKVITFNWSSVISATKYQLQINGGAVKDTSISGTSLTYTLPAAASATTAYTWNVKATNDNSQTQYNTSPFTFTVDLKAPATPGLSQPLLGSSVADTVRLVWVRNGTDVAYDSIYVANDSLFTNMIKQQESDQAYIRISDLGLGQSPLNSFYWWRVRSFDAVGNPSSFSGRLKFKLVP
jgi:hypothetical protein